MTIYMEPRLYEGELPVNIGDKCKVEGRGNTVFVLKGFSSFKKDDYEVEWAELLNTYTGGYAAAYIDDIRPLKRSRRATKIKESSQDWSLESEPDEVDGLTVI